MVTADEIARVTVFAALGDAERERLSRAAADISLLPEDPRRVVSVVELDRATPVRTDTRARLEYQGLTGVAQIALIGGEPGAPPLVAGPGQPMPTIFADQSDFQDLLESAQLSGLIALVGVFSVTATGTSVKDVFNDVATKIKVPAAP